MHIPFVMIDPGHGGADPGAVYGGVREADVNLAVGHALFNRLTGIGIRAIMSRVSDRTMSLAARCTVSNLHAPDLFISLHCNAAANPLASGVEVWTSPGRTDADRIAEILMGVDVLRQFRHLRPREDRTDGDADKEGHLAVLTGTRCPAVLVEMAFLSNDSDRAWLTAPENQQELAAALAHGISMALHSEEATV